MKPFKFIMILSILGFLLNSSFAADFILKNGSSRSAKLIQLRNDTLFFQGTSKSGKKVHLALSKSLFSAVILDSGDSLNLSLHNFPDSLEDSETNSASANSTLPDSTLTNSNLTDSNSVQKYQKVQKQIEQPKENLAHFYLKSGGNNQANFLGMKNDSLYLSGTLPDGTHRTIKLHKSRFRKVILQNGSALDLSLHNCFSIEDCSLTCSTVQNLSQKNLPKAVVYFASDPEGADILLDNIPVKHSTPFLLKNIKAGKHSLEARWQVGKSIWAGKQNINVQNGDTIDVSVRLKRSRSILSIESVPSGAEIHMGDTLSVKDYPQTFTPIIFKDLPPKRIAIRVLKEGYRDTSLLIDISPLESISQSILLSPELDNNRLNQQKQFLKKRFHFLLSDIFIYSSTGTTVLASIFYWMASNNFDEAARLKDKLLIPSIKNGPHYQDELKRNKEYYEAGKQKTQIANSLLSISAIGFLSGIILRF